MCGFSGYLGGLPRANVEHAALLEEMCQPIALRGPDDSGSWSDQVAGIALGFRRLSIIDLSQAGHQPMMSPTGRFVIVFNGEIYNHLDLRRELGRSSVEPEWRGHSDTESLLSGIESWGIDEAIAKTSGMFAFALWDRKGRTLTLGRDRLGEKPLYYGWQGVGTKRTFLFGSDLGSLRQHPSFGGDVNRGAMALMLRHNNIPAPHSIYKGIFKLEAGTLLTLSLESEQQIARPYWQASKAIGKGIASPFQGSESEAVDALEKCLGEAVGRQMVSDVPLGAFLSGGIDSSTIVALMQSKSAQPVRTFSIGFTEDGYSEAKHALAIARHLHTQHTELTVTHQDAINLIPNLPQIYTEPFADSSQIPTYLISRMAKNDVTVALTGDGGDELFAGYNRYIVTSRLWSRLQKAPLSARRAAAKAIVAISPGHWDKIGRLTPIGSWFTGVGDKMHKGASVLGCQNIEQVYRGLVSHINSPAQFLIDAEESSSKLDAGIFDELPLTGVERMMALDLVTYLSDDILVKVDRASMGASLETRVPMLDHNVVEFAWSLPLSMKLRNGVAKWPLRALLSRHVPAELFDRPKQGFGIPLHAWLRGPLRDWAETLLEPSRMIQEGYFEVAPIRRLWDDHISGKRNNAHHLWSILMLQSWLNKQTI